MVILKNTKKSVGPESLTRENVVRDEAEEAGKGQIMQDFATCNKKFEFYSKATENHQRICAEEGSDWIHVFKKLPVRIKDEKLVRRIL